MNLPTPASGSVYEFVRAPNDVRRKQIFETGEVTVVSRCDERSKQTPELGRARCSRSAAHDVLARAGDYLPCVSLRKPKDTRDVAVCIVERLPKDVGGPL